MTAKSKAAALVVVGGALLGGCAYSPATDQAMPVPVDAAAWFAQRQRNAARDAEQRQRAAALRAYLEQQNMESPLAHAPHLNRNAAPSDDGPVIAQNPPPSAPLAKGSRPACVGWFRICHFL